MSDRGTGSGLGLTIAEAHAMAIVARLTFSNDAGGGAVARLTLSGDRSPRTDP